MPFQRLLPQRTTAERLAQDIHEVLQRLEHDIPYVLMYWNAYRARDPLLELTQSTWTDHAADALLQLSSEQLHLATRFFDELSSLRLWSVHTEAMPVTLVNRLEAGRERLEVLGHRAIEALGGVPDPAPELVVPEGWGSLRRADTASFLAEE